jgi:hypothetical protein
MRVRPRVRHLPLLFGSADLKSQANRGTPPILRHPSRLGQRVREPSERNFAFPEQQV